MTSSNSRSDSYTRLCIKNLFFTWTWAYIKKGKSKKINFDDLPKIKSEDMFNISANKIKTHFDVLNNSWNKNDKIKYFVLRLLFKSYKWDLFLCFMLSILKEIFEFSSAFFIQTILDGHKYFPEKNYTYYIGLFSIVMIIFKTLGAVIEQYTYFYSVN